MASLTINPPPAKRLKTPATNNNNTSSTIKTISLVPFIDDFINTMYDKLSNGINDRLLKVFPKMLECKCISKWMDTVSL